VKEGDPGGGEFLDCGTCRASVAVRRHWHCGYTDRKDWVGSGFPYPPEWGRQLDDTCPGYLIRQPKVEEGFRAHLWFEKGLIQERYEGQELTPIVMDAVEVAHAAIAQLEAHAVSEAK